MKRRNAIRNIAVLSTGVGLLSSCNWWDTTRVPVYENISLDKDKWFFINDISRLILPVTTSEQPLTESPTHFVLTSVNDCFSPKDIQRFLEGCTSFQISFHENYGKEIQSEDLSDFVVALSAEDLPDSQGYFIEVVKNLRIRYFMSEENFLKNKLDFEFVPGRFSGCVKI